MLCIHPVCWLICSICSALVKQFRRLTVAPMEGLKRAASNTATQGVESQELTGSSAVFGAAGADFGGAESRNGKGKLYQQRNVEKRKTALVSILHFLLPNCISLTLADFPSLKSRLTSPYVRLLWICPVLFESIVDWK